MPERIGLGKILKDAGVKDVKLPKKGVPVWGGPEKDGITFSLLNKFMGCRERFRLLVVEGLKPSPKFDHKPLYGNMWHAAEEEYAKSSDLGLSLSAMYGEAKKAIKEHPFDSDKVSHWYRVCEAQFPIYVSFWKHHPDVVKRTPLLQEYAFKVPYRLPSGRTVLLRGKFDSVDLVTKGRKKEVWLMENKTKSDPDELKIERQLKFDCQTMMYMVALDSCTVFGKDAGTLGGVRYNVIKRPLSGGKGTIRQHKPTKKNPRGESDQEFYARVAEVIREDPPSYFMRYNVEITREDIDRFKKEFLNPVLENLCAWWDWITTGTFDAAQLANGLHWRHPFGLYNVLDEIGSSEYDYYLETGSEVGLIRTSELFPELKEGTGS